MNVRLNYDRDGLDIQVPDECRATVLRMSPSTPLADPAAALCDLLARPIASPPLRELAQGKASACVVISDVTRPVPNKILLPHILAELQAAGMAKANITILVGTGIHRPNEGAELEEMVGADLVRDYRFVNHAARDLSTHEHLGQTRRGTPVYVDKTYLAADLRITTGLIEPHLMAGFSGGRKSICPGVCALETVKVWHSPPFVEAPQAECGTIANNPVHEEALEIAQMARVDFIVNVVLNERRDIVGMFAGDLVKAHEAGVECCREVVSVPIDKPFDVVVTSSAGYPLDTTFYQAIKGLTGAMPAVKRGGIIILAAGMTQGIGGEEFTRLCREFDGLDAFMDAITQRYLDTDQWQIEEQAKAARHADIWVYTDGLDKATLAGLFVKPLDSVEDGIAKAMAQHGPDATLAIIPEGPYVLPAPRETSTA